MCRFKWGSQAGLPERVRLEQGLEGELAGLVRVLGVERHPGRGASACQGRLGALSGGLCGRAEPGKKGLMGGADRDLMAGGLCWSAAFPAGAGAESELSGGEGKARDPLTGLCSRSEDSICGPECVGRRGSLGACFPLELFLP